MATTFYPGETLSAAKLQQLGANGTYTPALHGSVTNPTLGSGSQALGWWAQNGQCVDLWWQFIFGSSGVNPGSGIYTVTYPASLMPMGGFPGTSVGTSRLIDTSAGAEATALISLTSTAMYPTLTGNPGLFVLDNRPWVWAAGDILGGHVTYLTA